MRPALLLVPALLAGAAFAQPAAPGPDRLLPGAPREIYLAPGRATTVLLRSDRKIAAISLASPVVTYRYDKALNQLELTPAVRTPGLETNLNLRIGADVYVLVLRIVNDVRAQFVREFAIGAPDLEEDLAAARPLAPAEIDLVAAARQFERAESDLVFREAQPRLRVVPLGRTYAWNDCEVRLDAVAQFLDLDLLVFRVRWLNATPDALYLDPRQYSLWAGGHKIPILARYRPSGDSVIWPGAWETTYLAVQGYRLSVNNAWALGLPPSAAELADPGEGPAP